MKLGLDYVHITEDAFTHASFGASVSPVSIARECADTLNFVRAIRNREFDNACKYGSNESDLKLLYVVSLLELFIF